jgi:hypothetical protein
MADFHKLKAGQILTVTAVEGRIHVRSAQLSVSSFTRSSVSFGPYLVDTDWLVDGSATVVIADHLVAVNATLMTSDGAPVDAVQASATLNPTGDDNALTFTARVYGAEGNSISVEYVDPSANDAALAVSVFRQAITVSLATGEAGAITSTAAEVKAAVEAHGEANSLVTVAIDASDSGAGDDGSGIVTAIAATALENGAGTGIGVALPGALLLDITGGKQYRNVGTQAAPAWVSPDDLHLYGAGAPVDYTDGSPPATGEGTAYPGALYSDITNANVYRNDGSRAEPVWVQLGDAAP